MRKYRRPYLIRKRKSTLRNLFLNRFFWLGIFTLIFLISISYFLFFSPIFQIKEIKISGNQNISTENIQEAIEANLEKKIFFFPTRSIFMFDSRKIEEKILDKFPQIGLIKIERKLPKILKVNIEEREAIAVLSSGENNYFIDKEGVCFEKVPSDDFKLPRINYLNSLGTFELGEQIVEKELLDAILTIFSELKSLGILIKETELISEERINVKTELGFDIYFSPQKDITWQITKLRADFEKQIPPERIKDLEYIELRFGDFAPFKYRD